MEVIGHRGAAALAPENTWEGFDVALDLGVDAVETDVRATRDGVLVLLHDERLERTTNGRGAVHETPWAEVKELDAGAWFAPGFAGARLPQLRDTLERYGQRTRLALEIKQAGIEREILAMVEALGLLEQVTFTAFELARVALIKAANPRARTGYLARDTSAESVARARAAGMDQFCPPAEGLTYAQVAEWHRLGLAVRAWGVKTPELMMRAIECGVDGMTVDFPHLLLAALGRSQPDASSGHEG